MIFLKRTFLFFFILPFILNFAFSKAKKSIKTKNIETQISEKEEKICEEKSEEENSELELFEWVKKFGDREEVIFWKNEFLKEERFKFLKRAAENFCDYRIFVRRAVREQNLPAELEYLPLIESGYNTRARSRSGAVGLWQFMANSVRPFLKLSEYVDERLDPWKSTAAGLSKLQENYKIFGDWFLALAAYNCGNGKLRSAIKKAGGEKDFWTLAANGFLPKQTADYVPELIAVAEICCAPKKFGIELEYFQNEFYESKSEEDMFDFAPIKKPCLLSSIASALEIEEELLKKLNPSFIKGFTPPAEESVLRLPKGTKEFFLEATEKIKPIEFPFKYKVVKGDSLWSISRKYGVSVRLLCDTNGIKESALLQINQILFIPKAK